MFMRGAWGRIGAVMTRKKPRSETPPAPQAPVRLCRYEELAMRENRLRQVKVAKPESKG